METDWASTVEIDQPSRMDYVYVPSDTGSDEDYYAGNYTNPDEYPSGTMEVLIILVSDRPLLTTLAQLNDRDKSFTNWLDSSECAFNSDENNPNKVTAKTWMYGEKNASLPTDEELKGANAVILAGSMDAGDESEKRNNDLRDYIRKAYEIRGLKLYGVGYGHQIIAEALLGDYVDIQKNKKSPQNWKFGLQEVVFEPKFKKDFTVLQERDSFSCQFLNSDHVALKKNAKLPADWKIVNQRGDGRIQGLWLESKVLTFQGLPEFDQHKVEKRVQEIAKKEKSNKEVVESYLARAKGNQPAKEGDAILFGQVVYEFLTESEVFHVFEGKAAASYEIAVDEA